MHYQTWSILAIVVLIWWLAYAACSYIRHELSKRKQRKLHGLVSPKRLPLLDPFFGTDVTITILNEIRQHSLLDGLNDRFLKYGNTYAFRMGSTSIIATCDPDNIRAISTDAKAFPVGEVRRKGISILHGRGIFAVEGDEWRESRAALRPCFAKGQHEDVRMLESHFREFLKRLECGGNFVDMQNEYNRLTMSTAMEYFFGISPHQSSTSAEVGEFVANSEYVNHSVYYSLAFGAQSPIAWWRYLPTKRAMRSIHAFVEEQVRQAFKLLESESKGSEDRYIFLHELCKTVTDPELLRDQVLTSMLGGKDTTASLLSHVTFELARKPEIWRKLQREVSTLSEPLEMSAIRNVDYVRYCLLEGLRLYTVVPINMRSASKDASLPVGGGADGSQPIQVSENTVIWLAMYSMHRREDVWGPDANEFKPERWEKIDPGFSFSPFGAGPRTCLGQQFAMNEASFILVRTVQTFEKLEPISNAPWKGRVGITLDLVDGCKVKLYRKPSSV